MIFFAANVSGIFEEEEEEEEEELEAGIDDELLGELADDAVSDDGLLEELDPLLKSPLDVLVPEDAEEDPLKEEGVKVFDDEEEEDVDDYDSFDDEDEM
jgi:hypothetical protein